MSYTPAHLHVNRAAVLTLWAAVVAERLGFGHEEALTLGRALAGLTAHAKGIRLGIFEPASSDEVRERRERLAEGQQLEVQLMGRTIPVVGTPEGLRAITKGEPLKPRSRGAVPDQPVRPASGRGLCCHGGAGPLAAAW